MYCVMCVLGHSAGSDPATSRTIAHQAPLSMGLSRQEYWSGLLFPSLGNHPIGCTQSLHTETEPMPPALAGRFFTTEPPGKPQNGL